MGYGKEIYQKALEIKNQSRKKALSLSEQKKHEIYSKFEALRNIETELSACGAKIALAAISENPLENLQDLKNRCDDLIKQRQTLLERAGITQSDLEPEFECSICDDTGYHNGKLCACVKKIAKQLAFMKLSSEMPIDNCRFDNFNLAYYSDQPDDNGIVPRSKMGQIFKLCYTYAKNFSAESENLLFIGQAGLGKTHLSLAIANEVLNKGFGVIYGPAMDIVTKIEKDYFYKSGGYESNMDAFLESDLLIIDDLGTEVITHFSVSVIYNIINTRILRKKPTIVSTNLSLKEIEEKYSARLSSRFIGNFTMRQFFGSDIRQLKQIENIKSRKIIP